MSAKKHKGKTVLIVDDNDAGIRYLTACLKRHDVDILSARNGIDALNLYKAKKIDMVLMDIGMPIMNGFEAAKAIIGTDPKAVVIMQSAYTMNNEQEASLAAGAKDYLSKPVDRDKLAQVLDTWL